MNARLTDSIRDLGRALAELKQRVRAAVAGELGRAVSGAVQQLVQAVVAGRADPPRSGPSPPYRRPPDPRWGVDDDEDHPWGRPYDPWADDPDADDDRDRLRAAPVRPGAAAAPDAGVAVAVAAGVYAAKWWVSRRGTWLAAAGVGLGVGLLGALGGPVARTVVAVLAAIGDILGATDALGAGAARLEPL